MSNWTQADLDMFASLGVPPDLFERAGVNRVTDLEAREEFGIRGDGDMSGVVYPYRHPITGERVTARLRRDKPEVIDGKTPKKYVCPFGDKRLLYFPPGAAELLRDRSVPIVLVEAEKSSLAITAWAARRGRRMLALALGGCWGWRAKVGKRPDAKGNRVDERGPTPGLEYLADGRKVYVLLDANAATNEDVRHARAKLVAHLKSQRAQVVVLDLPQGKWNGPDDYLAAKDDAAFAHLFESEGGFDLVKLGDLLREPAEAVAFCVQDMLPAAGLSLWPAKPKVGKSTLQRHLALCVARGDPFLGRETVRGTVIYLALEEKRSEVRKHFEAMGATEDDEIYIHAAHAPASALAALRKLAEEKNPALIIIDPLQKMMRAKDTNDYAEITLALEPFLILARQTGAHIAVAHHAGKTERTDPTDSVLGSTALFGGVDVAVILKKHENYRTVATCGRYGVDLEETVLTLSANRIPTVRGSRKQVEDERVAQNILEVVTDPKERSVILKEAEGQNKIKNRVFKTLLKDGRLCQVGGGKKGDPYLYFLPKTPCTHIAGLESLKRTKTLQFPKTEKMLDCGSQILV